MKLVNTKDTYEVGYPKGDDPKPIFILRKLSTKEAGDIEDAVTLTERKEEVMTVKFLSGTASRMKIKFAVMGWKNIEIEDGKPAPCTDDNKDKLPNDIRAWLENIIDTDNGFKGIPEDDRKKS